MSRRRSAQQAVLGFRHRVYLCVLCLVLLFFNGTVLTVAWHSSNMAFISQRDKLLTQQQYIVQTLTADVELISVSRPLGLPLLYRRRTDELLADGILLAIRAEEGSCSSFPAAFTPQITPETGQRVWYVDEVNGLSMLITVTAPKEAAPLQTITAAFPMQDFFDGWNDTLRSITLLSLGCSLLLAIVLYFLLRMLTTPLARLEAATRQLSDGDYTVRVPVTSEDELGRLAHSFNAMTEQLSDHITRLQDAAQEKQRLLDALAHELRTPLAGISASVQYMQMARLSEDAYYDTLEDMAFETGRMQNLADSILSLSSLRQGEKAAMASCSLHAIGQRAIAVLEPRARQTGVTLHLAAEAEPEVLGDAVLLESLFVNLLDNACKACALLAESLSPAELEHWLPLVQLRLCVENGVPTALVTDNGAGMTEETLRRIGEPFFREDKARSRRWGGAGLGVSICRAITDAHGARLSYSSKKGAGTIVRVSFALPHTTKGAPVTMPDSRP